MRAILMFILIIGYVCLFGQNKDFNSKETILLNLGFSPKEFDLIPINQVNCKNNLIQSLGFDSENSDSIIISKVDSADNAIDCSNKDVPYTVIFCKTTFKKDVYFNKTTFRKPLFIIDCKFQQNFEANFSKFISLLAIEQCHFYKWTELNYTKFEHRFMARDSHFDSNIQLVKASLSQKVDFSESYFGDTPLFWETNFNDSVIFYNCRFSRCDFIGTRFKNYLSLEKVKATEIDIENAFFPSKINLAKLEISIPLDFNYIRDSVDDKKYRINIYKTDFKKIIVTDKFSLWFDEKISIDQKNSIYKQYLRNLNELGYRKLFESIDVEYKEFENENYNGLLAKCGYYLSKWWWNFGYDKERIFLISFIFIFIFSIFVHYKIDLYINNVYQIMSLSKRMDINKSQKKKYLRLISNYYTTLLYTIFIFFNLKLDFEKISFKNYRAGIFILIIYCTGIICTAFIINLIVKI